MRRKKIKEYCAKGLCFALEMGNTKIRFFGHKFTCAIFLCCWTTFSAKTQNDTSLLLRAEQLSVTDVKSWKEGSSKALIRSASRSDEDPAGLPFTTWVISSEDILRYGFVTLADVLKAAPGIRVSQPGNAIEGETFMMRGLSGNQYVKILINDVPVKPSSALGMPIGAQLPIRAAERIEVLYGPVGGMMYGNEACAGVVNIIIKETERPIFTQADLGFGKFGYNSLDLTFGGKIFRGRNLIRFSLYGSSTVRSETDIFWDNNVLNVEKYMVNGISKDNLPQMQHYRGSADSNVISLTSPASHDSRLFGIQMKWRGLAFSYHRMTREDVTFLGMNPLAISYSAPGNFHKDRIDTYSLSCWKRTERAYFHSSWSMENYLVGNNSSANYVFDQINQLSFVGQDGANLSQVDKNQLLDNDFFYYNSNSRFRYSRSVDLRWDAYYNVRLWKKLWLTNGVQISTGWGMPLLTRYFLPPRDRVLFPEQDDFNGPFPSNNYIYLQANVYANLDWQGKKLRVIAGSGGVLPAGCFTPRFAAIYRIDSTSSVYVNAAQSIKHIHPYQFNNTYSYNPSSEKIDLTAYRVGDDPVEKIRGAELGYRFRRSEIVAFYQNSYQLLRDGYLAKETSGGYNAGFRAAPGLAHRIWGIQSRLVAEAHIPVKTNNVEQRDIIWRGEFFTQYSRGKEWFGYGLPASGQIRNYPHWITQFRMSFRTGRVQITAASNRQTSVLSKSVTYRDIWQRSSATDKYPTFRTWDAMFRFYLNKNFVLYFNLINAFNKEAYGLDAFGTVDDALAPVQQGRLFRFGINYNMN
jgi:TonB-dependent Receptor Plug Domain